jgi:hypothetical protein
VNEFSRYKGHAFHSVKRYTINWKSYMFHTLGGLLVDGYSKMVNGYLRIVIEKWLLGNS